MLESDFCWNALAGWSPISITSVVATMSKRSAGTTLRSQNGPDLLFVAEQDDTALRTETFEGHDGPFDGCLGSVIAAHGINTNL